MRKLKKMGAILMTGLLIMSATACGTEKQTGQSGSNDVQAKVAAAQKKMAELKSAEAVMDMDMSITAKDEDGKEQSFDMKTTSTMVMFNEPMKVKVDMKMSMGELGETTMEMYAEEKDGKYISYTNLLGAWTATELDKDAIQQYSLEQNADMYLNGISNVKEAGSEEVNGEKTTKYEAEISGEAIEELAKSTGVFDLAGLSDEESKTMEEMFTDAKGIKITVWLNEDNYIVKISEDLTDLMSGVMEKASEASGSEEDTGSISKFVINMTYSNFDKATDFEIPEDAQKAEVVS